MLYSEELLDTKTKHKFHLGNRLRHLFNCILSVCTLLAVWCARTLHLKKKRFPDVRASGVEVMQKVSVNGGNASPVYANLKAQLPVHIEWGGVMHA